MVDRNSTFADRHAQRLIPSGVPELDTILGGGLPRNALYLIQGAPGTGKTTLGLQFLAEGDRRGEHCLLISVAHTGDEIQRIAASHQMDLGNVAVKEITADRIADRQPQSVLRTNETDLQTLLAFVVEAVAEADRTAPVERLVIDSLLEMRLLSQDTTTYHRELMLLKSELNKRGITALLLDFAESDPSSRQLQGVFHGVISMHRRNPRYGITHRQIEVEKIRGHPFVEGLHDIRIEAGGVHVFPRILPMADAPEEVSGSLPSTLVGLDEMIGGGLEFGSTTVLLGHTGSGKSTLSTVFALSAARHGHRAALFLFEERAAVFRQRARDLGMDLGPSEAEGLVEIHHHNPSELSPGEFNRAVVSAIEERNVRLIVLDSLTGYLAAMTERADLIPQIHSLLNYLGHRQAISVLTVAEHGLMSPRSSVEVDLSYLADAIIHLRQYPDHAHMNRSINILKKRLSSHGRTIRQLTIDGSGVEIGAVATSDAMGQGCDAS